MILVNHRFSNEYPLDQSKSIVGGGLILLLVLVLMLPFSLDATAIVEIITLQTVEFAGSLYLFCSESEQDEDSADGPNFFFIFGMFSSMLLGMLTGPQYILPYLI